MARQLRDAARADIAAIMRRVGSCPVSAAEAGGAQALLDEAHAIIARDGAIGHKHRITHRLYVLRHRAQVAQVALVTLLHGRHYLVAADLVAFLVLLSIETGLEIECLKTLRVDCLRHPKAGTVEVHYLKRRARGAELKHIRVRDAGPMTPGGVMRAVVSLTAQARRLLPSENLWVYWRDGALRDDIKHPETLATWVRRHDIRDDDGQPLHLTLSRLRKTHKALWYLKSQGEIARFAVGHTPEIAARHYADIPSLRPLHEATVASAFQEAHDSALKLSVVTPRQETALRRRRHQDAAALDAVQDVWLTGCSGFTNSPFAPAGSPCPHAAWACLECPNAIITAAKLPALFAFLDFVESERARLSAPAWRAKFGQAHARITQQILPHFPRAVIAKAKAEPRPRLHLPIEVTS